MRERRTRMCLFIVFYFFIVKLNCHQFRFLFYYNKGGEEQDSIRFINIITYCLTLLITKKKINYQNTLNCILLLKKI